MYKLVNANAIVSEIRKVADEDDNIDDYNYVGIQCDLNLTDKRPQEDFYFDNIRRNWRNTDREDI